MKSTTFAFALFVAAFLAAGCSSSSSPSNSNNNNNNNSGSVPTAGTSFTTADIDNGSSVTYDTIKTTGLTDPVHTGAAVREVYAFSIGSSITYQSFLTNGDLAVMGTPWSQFGFKVLPFASHTTVNDTFWDGFESNTLQAIYNGPGAMFTVNGQSYPTDSVTVSYIYVGGTTYEEHYSYIPALGVIAYDRSETDFSQSCKKLVSFSAK